jgi:CheY-like chemotaxis protein
MSGLEVARILRQNEQTKSTPILAMSASPDAKNECLEAGCNAFILKPFDIDHLLNELSAQIPS